MPVVGLVYWVVVADDPQEYRAICLQDYAAGCVMASWFIWDLDGRSGRAASGRYVEIVRLDKDHAATLARKASLALERQ